MRPKTAESRSMDMSLYLFNTSALGTNSREKTPQTSKCDQNNSQKQTNTERIPIGTSYSRGHTIDKLISCCIRKSTDHAGNLAGGHIRLKQWTCLRAGNYQ